MDPSSEDTAVQDFLEILEEHRKNCERQGKYVEAEISKNRLEELRLHEENRKRVSIIGVPSSIAWMDKEFCNNFKIFLGSNAFASNC